MSEMCFQVTTKVCATCNYWQNFDRKFDFAGKKPIRVKVAPQNATCAAWPNKISSPGTTCMRWTRWVMIP